MPVKCLQNLKPPVVKQQFTIALKSLNACSPYGMYPAGPYSIERSSLYNTANETFGQLLCQLSQFVSTVNYEMCHTILLTNCKCKESIGQWGKTRIGLVRPGLHWCASVLFSMFMEALGEFAYPDKRVQLTLYIYIPDIYIYTLESLLIFFYGR